MKKVILAAALAVVLTLGGLGGAAMAAPPDKSPVDAITSGIADILAALGIIDDKVDGIDTQLNDLSDAVDGLTSDMDHVSDNVSLINSKVDTMVRMHMLQDSVSVTDSNDDVTFAEKNYRELRHVVITLNWQLEDADDYIQILADFDGESRPIFSGWGPGSGPSAIASSGTVTVEFATDHWMIKGGTLDVPVVPLTVRYSATETWMPQT